MEEIIEKTDNTENNLEGMEKEKPERGEELDSLEEISKKTSEGAEVKEVKQEMAKTVTESIEKVAVADKVNDNKEEKSGIYRRIIACCVELAAAFILLVISGGLFINTRGTMLLYVSVATGRISRFYWIIFIAAVVFLVIGLFTLKRLRGAGKHQKKGASR